MGIFISILCVIAIVAIPLGTMLREKPPKEIKFEDYPWLYQGKGKK